MQPENTNPISSGFTGDLFEDERITNPISTNPISIEFLSECRKVIHREGVTITTSDHRFELSVTKGSDIWEQRAIQLLREWIRARPKAE